MQRLLFNCLGPETTEYVAVWAMIGMREGERGKPRNWRTPGSESGCGRRTMVLYSSH